MSENDMISHEDYYEFHESKEDLYMPCDFINYVECCSCLEMFPENEVFPFENDNFCPECAEATGVYRCVYCGKTYEKSDKCPECGRKRETKKEEQ